jgi:hypothetical protein
MGSMITQAMSPQNRLTKMDIQGSGMRAIQLLDLG